MKRSGWLNVRIGFYVVQEFLAKDKEFGLMNMLRGLDLASSDVTAMELTRFRGRFSIQRDDEGMPERTAQEFDAIAWVRLCCA